MTPKLKPCPNHPATVIHQQSGESCPMFCQSCAPAAAPIDAHASRLAALEEAAKVADGIVEVRGDDEWWDGYCAARKDIATAIRSLPNKTGEGAGGDCDLAARKAVNTILAELLAPLISDVGERITVGNRVCSLILAALASNKGGRDGE